MLRDAAQENGFMINRVCDLRIAGGTGKAIALLLLLSASVTWADNLVDLPDWNDEAAAYASRNLDASGAQIHVSDGTYSRDRIDRFSSLSNLSDTHGNTEGDDLWTAYQMYKRLDGIHQTAADDWFSRASSLAGYFKNNYVGGSAWDDDARFNHDHMYGWGLADWAEGQSDTAAIPVINAQVTALVQWNANTHVFDPGDNLGNGGSAFGRRWARQLRFAVRAAEVSPIAPNIAWRNKVIDLVLQTPNWDAARNMYWMTSQGTDSRRGSGAYAAGDRISVTFHMGIWMEALWHAWRVLDAEQDPRAAAARQRIIDMATFYRDVGPDSSGQIHLNLGYNINSGAIIRGGGSGSPTMVYNLGPINGLVMAYKFTGDASYLNLAWTLYRNWQNSQSGNAGVVEHYVDSELSSATGFSFLANNKGELQYVYALFENGGNPTLVDGTTAGPPPKKPLPPILEGDISDPGVTTVSLQASPQTVAPGQAATLTWSSTGATSCTASLGWSGPRDVQGSESTPAISNSTQYRLSCLGAGAGASDTTTVFVSGGDNPTGSPSWYTNAADRTWINMRTAVGASTFNENDPTRTFPDWDFGLSESGPDYHSAVIENWNGGVAREDFFVLGLSGGHRGSSQNTIYEFGPFTSETPDWHWYGTDPTKYDMPSHEGQPGGTISNWSAEENKPYYSDGRPSAAHTYDHMAYIPDLGNGVGNLLFRPIASFVYSGTQGNTGSFTEVASFKFTSNNDVGGTYEPRGTYPDFDGRRGPGGLVEWDPVSEKVWIFSTGGRGNGTRPVHSFDPRTSSYVAHADDVAGSFSTDTDGGSLDPDRQLMAVNTDSGLLLIDISAGREGDSVFVSNYSGGIAKAGNIGMEYDPVGRKFVGYRGGANVYTMEAPADFRNANGSLNGSATWRWIQVPNGQGGATPSAAEGTGTYGRFRYIPSINAFAVINAINDAIFVYKVPSGGL